MDKKIFFWGRMLHNLGKNLNIYMKNRLDDVDLKRSQIQFLHYICKKESINQNQLSNINHVNKSTTTRNIKRLLECDYIERKKDTNDKRKFIIEPTLKGRDFNEKLYKIFDDWNIEITKDISKDELNQFEKTAEKIINRSDRFIERMLKNEQK